MPLISKVLVVQPDPGFAEALRFAFEREGAEVVLSGATAEVAEGPQLVITGAIEPNQGLSLLSELSTAARIKGGDLPVLYVGNHLPRETAMAQGASEVLPTPAYLRDVVTAARLLASPHPNLPDCHRGELRDHFGLFYLIRAVVALGGRRVLNLIRGLRRGEVRFYDGEVTSAQVGGLHGLAALYQLMLWNEARFELRLERVVRRQQIPMPTEELLAEAERFLTQIGAVGGDLSPSAVYQRVGEAIDRVRGDLPAEVMEVLFLFDGTRCLADVIEDSPYRTFETLRIARRLAEIGLIEVGGNERATERQRQPLQIDEWRVTGIGSSSTIELPIRGHGKMQPRRRLDDDGPSEAAARASDWGPLLPAHGEVDLEGFTQVVPSAAAAGEIVSGAAAARAMRRLKTEPPVQIDDRPTPIRMAALNGDLEPERAPAPRPKPTPEPEPAAPTETVGRTGMDTVPLRRLADRPSEPAAPAPAPAPTPAPRADSEPSLLGAPPSAAADSNFDIDIDMDIGEASGVISMPDPASRSRPLPVVAAGAVEVAPEATAVSVTATAAADAAVVDTFSADEEAFFKRGSELTRKNASTPAPPDESFEDLDEPYDVPRGFWKRLFTDPNAELKPAKKSDGDTE